MVRDGYKECPVCFEEIKAKARVCRFCGAVLTDEPLPQLLPIEQARAMEKAQATEEETARAETRKREEAPPPVLTELTKEEEAALENFRRVIREQYEKLEDSLAVKHRLRLEEFLQRAEEEYRTASVLFVDVTGYTALSEKIRPEYLKRILDSFYEICTQIVGAYNGFVVKFEGDACLAVFGAPVAYDRDTESAVRAALEIREMARTFPVIQGTRISVSAAVATGEILSSITRRPGRVDFDVFGPAVNLAARIEAAAESDAVVVCSETYELVKGVFEFRPIPPREFKNIAEPVATYEALGIKTEGLARRDFSMPLVGRERELARLSRSWESFLASLAGDADRGEAAREKGREPSSRPGAGGPHGHVFVGGPGLGKTRLAMEFLSRLSIEIRLLSAECNPHDRNNPYALWRQAISRLWQGQPND
ncbi:MAG TPA: adenylate/guanylate cyclase domain-containing protein, partial [Sumerlaeia bacterium]|nr:adenylate/guanylate cyclase domain-containing protein [Sumerlaeia bacterium]